MITDELLFRYLNRETSKTENRRINEWLATHPDQSVRLDHLREMAESEQIPASVEDAKAGWALLEPKLLTKTTQLKVNHSLTIRLVRIAAVLLVLVGSGLLWLNQVNNHLLRNRDLITKTVFLPDGTQVDLGPGSKLAYDNEYIKGNRVIRLTGEAFFDVTSDPDHPFTVIAGKARIKVTGTQFVVNASPGNKEVQVSVKSGKVLFYNSDTLDKNSFRMGLVEGEKGIFYPALNRMDKTRDPYFQSTP